MYKSPGGRALAVSPGGERLALGGDGLWVFDRAAGRAGQPVFHLKSADQAARQDLNGVAYGRRFLVTASDTTSGAHVWDANTGEHLRALKPTLALEGPSSPFAGDVALSPDESLVAVGARNGEVHLFNPASGRQIRFLGPLTGRGAVQAVRFSPDGRLLLTATLNGTVLLWDTTTWMQVRALASYGGARVMSATFSPDGGWVALSTSGGWVHRTPTTLPDLRRRVCARVVRDFLDEEPQVYGLAPGTLACPDDRERTRLE
ncbi:hypothetical protein [Deinococcus apachensis]|uniref:WD40 repeat domain-containing protein n=1 Tax=Deinococcus apachensis TaxID=309886 RepID=UPI00316AD3FC